MGYPDPINPSYEATTAMYQTCLEEAIAGINRRPQGRVTIMVATHNEDTVKFALKKYVITCFSVFEHSMFEQSK